MRIKLLTWVAALGIAALFIPSSALADSIVFQASGGGVGTFPFGWTWTGGAGSQLLFSVGDGTITVNRIGTSPAGPFVIGGEFNVLSGPAIGGSGTPTNPFLFGPGGLLFFPLTPLLFVGTFSGVQAVFTGPNTLTFVGNVSGSVDTVIYNLLGFPLNTTPTLLTGTFIAVLQGTASFSGGGSGTSVSGTLVVTPVPESGTFSLVGMGLVSMAGFICSRLHRRRPA